MNINTFPTLLQTFFAERLLLQRHVSPHTIAAYRDTFRLLLDYTQKQLGKAPSDLQLEDLNAELISHFLQHLEQQRGNGARSRNLRLAAIRSFFRYAAFEAPEHAWLIQRVLAMPNKRYERALVHFLSEAEMNALLAAPDRQCWGGRRDYALILLALQTGMRVSELVGLCWANIVLGTTSHLSCYGKGRKARCIPLTKQSRAVLRTWRKEQAPEASTPVFPNARGGSLSTDGVQYLLSKHVHTAQQHCQSLKGKRVSPHVLRHTTAMNLLHAGIDHSLIALWLGHESVETTQMYIDADLKLKEKILEKTSTQTSPVVRYQPDDQLLAFLNSL
jgi:site-specific recombinase XerD